MPKEITHWLIAEEAAKRLTQSTVSQALMRHSGMMRLGAILHDVLYYVRSGKANIRRCTDIANTLHGANGEDTLALLRMIASGIAAHKKHRFDIPREASVAFLFGVMTHYWADVVFHPYIYYISGNCLQDATFFSAWENHRSLEATIDLMFCQEYHRKADEFSLLRDISQHTSELSSILQCLADEQQTCGISVRQQDYEEGYKMLAWLRILMVGAFPNHVIGYAERFFSAFQTGTFSPEMRSYLALRYTNYSHWRFANTHQSLEYNHPVSGEYHTTTLSQLFEQSVQDSVNFWGILEETILIGKPLELHGKSLEIGLQGIPSKAMKYFAEIL